MLNEQKVDDVTSEDELMPAPSSTDVLVFEGDVEVTIRVTNPTQGRLVMQQLWDLAKLGSVHVKFADLPWTIIKE